MTALFAALSLSLCLALAGGCSSGARRTEERPGPTPPLAGPGAVPSPEIPPRAEPAAASESAERGKWLELRRADPADPISYGSPPPRIPSRATDTLPGGHYFMPAGLAEEYSEKSSTLERVRADMRLLRMLGSRYYRVGISWDSIETSPGTYDWKLWDWVVDEAWRAGITLLPYVCYTPAWAASDKQADLSPRSPPADLAAFSRFMEAIARRYKGRIRSWELWNRPDLEQYWIGDAETFARMVLPAARALRRVDASVRIVLGGMVNAEGDFIRRTLSSPEILAAFDAINVHGTLGTWNPTPAEGFPDLLQGVASLIGKLSPVTGPGNDAPSPGASEGAPPAPAPAPRPDVWLAESGYEHTVAHQAAAVWTHHLLASASEVPSLTTWFRIHDRPGGESVIGGANDRHLGLVDTGGRPKPAFGAFRLHARAFDQPYRLIYARPPATGSPGGGAVAFIFEKLNGDLVVSAWRTGPASDHQREILSLPVPGSAGMRASLETLGLEGTPTDSPARIVDGEIRGIPLEGDQVFIGLIDRDPPVSLTGL